MYNPRNSIFIPNKSKQFNNIDFRRSTSRRIVISKTYFHKYPITRHKSTFIDQIPASKYKMVEVKEKENEKNDMKLDRKTTFRPKEFNQLMKSISIKQQPNNVKRLWNKRNSFIKRKVGIQHFYTIRKEINKKLKNTYKSPYMDYLIEKGYYIHHKKVDYPKYYNYYMICYLMNNKRCQLTSRYYDYLLFYNQQEYLIRYFDKNEIYIILNYLLYFIYNKDIKSVVKNKKKILSDGEILNMFNNLIKSNYNFLGTMEIFDEIAVYYRNMGLSNINLSKFITLENIKPVYGEEIHYKYAKDIPTLSFPNCYPNFFPLVGVMLNYIKKFLNVRKFLKLKTNNGDNINKNTNLNLSLSKKDKSYYYKKNNKNKKNKINDDNILMNLSLSLSQDNYINDEPNESEEKKNLHNSNRRLKIDIDIYDVETLVNKILFGYKNNNNNKKSRNNKINKSRINEIKEQMCLFKKEKINLNRKKKTNSMRNINKVKMEENRLLSTKATKSSINLEFLASTNSNINIFKTSLKTPNLLINKNNRKIQKCLSSKLINKNKKNISIKNIHRILSKDNLKLKNYNDKEFGSEYPSPFTPLNILRYSQKTLNDNKKDKDKNNNKIRKKVVNFSDFINKENKEYNNNELNRVLSSSRNNMKKKISFNKCLFNFNEKNINSSVREVSSNNWSSQNNIFNKFKDTQKFVSNSTKNKYIVNKYISLKKINSLPRKNYNTPKNKKFFRSQKAFTTYSGMNFDDKVVNVWENNKLEVITVKEAYTTSNLFKKIKYINNKNQKEFKKSTTFNEIIKCPNIYITNLG